MNILIKTTRISYRTNKDQRGNSFRIDKNKGKRGALEWDDFVPQEQLKYLMYVES